MKLLAAFSSSHPRVPQGSATVNGGACTVDAFRVAKRGPLSHTKQSWALRVELQSATGICPTLSCAFR